MAISMPEGSDNGQRGRKCYPAIIRASRHRWDGNRNGTVGPAGKVGYAGRRGCRDARTCREVAMWIVLLGALLAGDSATKAEVDAGELKKLAGSYVISHQEHGEKKSDSKALAPLSVEIGGGKVST